MKFASTLAIALGAAACGPPEPQAHPDARVPGPVDGAWAITWDCLECEPGSVNPLAYATRLTIAGDVLTYDDPDCGDCGDVHAGVPNLDGTCITVDGGGDEPTWDGYQLCGFGDSIEGVLTFRGYPGPPEPRTYQLDGAALP
jgi:hypothetical protein